MIDNPVIYYFKEVLGISSFLIPQGVEAFSEPEKAEVSASGPVDEYRVSGEVNSPVMVISSEFLRDQERDLLGKMLGAIQIKNYYLVEGVSRNHNMSDVVAPFKGQFGILFGRESYELLAVESYSEKLGQLIRELKVKWLVTLKISNLIGDDSQLMNRKRQVWEHLKSLQRVM